MRIIKGVVLTLVLLAAASGQVPCPTGPLSEEQLTTLVKGKVAEVRVRQFIASCGLKFVADGGAVRRLKAAGATTAELEALRRAKRPLSAGPLVVNGVSMEFVPIPAGEFVMGSESGEALKRMSERVDEAQARFADVKAHYGANHPEYRKAAAQVAEARRLLDSGDSDEKPVHRVRITKAFEMGKYEVTQAQWEAVMGSNPSYFKGADRPVELVNWNDAQGFLLKLNARNDGYRYRLPAEAEWEYAARAGTTGDNAGDLDGVAWYRDNSKNQTHPVGQKQANAWGLHDMQGNVWEWCQDWYDGNYYRNSPAEDPQGPSSGRLRVLRGGSWVVVTRSVRVADRGRGYPDNRYVDNGFRCVRERFP